MSKRIHSTRIPPLTSFQTRISTGEARSGRRTTRKVAVYDTPPTHPPTTSAEASSAVTDEDDGPSHQTFYHDLGADQGAEYYGDGVYYSTVRACTCDVRADVDHLSSLRTISYVNGCHSEASMKETF